MRRARSMVSLALCLTSVLSASAALGKPVVRHPHGMAAAERAQEAKRLLKQGGKYYDLERYSDACPLLEESLRLAPEITTKYWLAECYAKTNRTPASLELFREIVKASKSPAQIKIARERSKELEALIGPVMLSVVPATMGTLGLELRLDGSRLQDSWEKTGRTTIMLEIGEHVLVAMAPGKQPWRQSFVVASHEVPVIVSVPRLLDEVPPPPSPSSNNTKRGVVALVTFLGATTFAVGLGAGFFGIVKEDQRANLFPATVTTLAGGGLGLMGSVWLWNSDNGSSNSKMARAPLRFSPTMGPGGGFVGVEGSF